MLTGTTHTGKTFLSQKLLERYKYPYLSVDHIKMGLIRSGRTNFRATDDDKLADYLWPIVKEIIKTVIENNQNLIIEGDYIPPNWEDDFESCYLDKIRYICLIMTEKYIDNNMDKIKNYENVVEKRFYSSEVDIDILKRDNNRNLDMCVKYGNRFILINDSYNVDEFMTFFDNECGFVRAK